MITPDQLQAQVDTNTEEGTGKPNQLTNYEVLLLLNLVKSYPPYQANKVLFPGVYELINKEKTDRTEKTHFLRAVLAALNELPEIDAESSGTDKAPGFFSVKGNWQALAQDVLNVWFDAPNIGGRNSFVLVQRRIQDITLREDFIPKRG